MTSLDRPSARSLLLLAGLAALVLGLRLAVVPHLGITLYVDEAQYWTWSQEMAWGYFSKPPGVAALVWLSTRLFGDGVLGVKALAMACYPAAALACWAAARRLYDERTALWCGIAVLTLPMFGILGLFVSTDALLTLFWSLALWAYLRALDDDRWSSWLLLGAIAGVGLMSKYTMAAWLGAAFLHLLACHRHRLGTAKPWLAAALALLLLAPNILWNVQHDFPTLKHTADITLHKPHAGGAGELGEFWVAQWVGIGPLFGCLLPFLVLAPASWRDERSRLLLWFALPLWLLVSVQAFKSGANANWAAPAFAPGVMLLVAWLVRRSSRRLLVSALALNVLLTAVVYSWPDLLAAAGVKEPARKNPFRRAQGWDGLGRVLAPIIAAHPAAALLADNRTLLAHMRFELRAQHPVAISWNPSGLPNDHYKMTTDLRPWQGRDAIFITEDPLTAEITSRFAATTELARLHVPLDATGSVARDMQVYLLQGFRGY